MKPGFRVGDLITVKGQHSGERIWLIIKKQLTCYGARYCLVILKINNLNWIGKFVNCDLSSNVVLFKGKR